MQRDKRNTTTTTTRKARNSAAMADSVKDTRLKMGRLKAVRPTATNNVTNEQLRKRKTENSNANHNLNAVNTTELLNQSCNSDSTESNCSGDQKSQQQTSDSKVKIASEHIKVLKKSRSEPIEGSSSSESELRKVKSDNWDHNDEAAQSCNMEVNSNDSDLNHDDQKINDQQNDPMQTEDLTIDSYEEAFDHEIEQKTEQELTAAEVNGCDEETEAVVSPKDKITVDTSSDHVDRATGVEGEDEGEQNKKGEDNDDRDGVEGEDEGEQNKKGEDNDDRDADQTLDDDVGGNGGGDEIIQHMKNKTKSTIIPPIAKSNTDLPKSTSPTKSTPATPTATTSECRERPTPRSIRRPTPNSPKPQTKPRRVSKQYDFSTTPETHSKLQSLVDLVLWRDASKTAFIFGFGTFIIISSSYAKDFNFSLISVTSYISLVYLAIVFLHKSFMKREVMDREDWPESYVWGEEEAIWFAKLILPYLNEFLLKLRGIFSGDPAMTMKVALMLFVLARCGSSITLWKTVKLGFFGVFVVPKLCSSYSAQITAYGNFWFGRFRDAWESCSHKKALAFAIFTLVWNFSSVIARAWAAFMLFVAFRYYQQSLITQDFMEEQTESYNNNVHARHLARNRCRIPTSSGQRKQKKSF